MAASVGMGRTARLRAASYQLLWRRQLWAVGVLLVLAAAGLFWASPHLQAWYHFRAARAELQRYHNPQAIRHLQVCLRVWPEDPDVLLMAARATRRGGNYDEAQRVLEKYQLARGLDDAASFEQLLLSAERNVDRVADQCWRRVELGDPESPLILEALARGYMRQYRLNNAGACLNRWLESEPENAQAYCLEGILILDYFHARSAAEKSYRRAVELDPEHDVARLGLAIILVDTQSFAEAAEHLEYLRERQPDNLSVQVGLAECRAALGEEAEAVRLLDGLLAQQPQFAPALTLRGRLALESGEYTEAETYSRQAIALNPPDRRARSNLVLSLLRNGKEKEAQQQQQELEQRDKDLTRFNEIVTKEMAHRPSDPALHCALGQLLLRGGYGEEGLRWLTSALRLDPEYAPAREALAEYYQKKKSELQKEE